MRCQKTIFLFFLIILACSSDKEEPIPSELATYSDRFIEEAKARGIDMDLSTVTIQFLSEEELGGYCGFGYIAPARVAISNTDACWYNRTDTEKEILMFHELGHSVLRRLHQNDTLTNGDFKSMMFDGNQFVIYGPYMSEKREYYLDELFDPSTPAPGWAQPKTTSVEIFNDSINSITSVWSFTKGTGTDPIAKQDDQIFVSPGRSLSIRSTTSVSNTSSYWRHTVSPAGIPVGAQLVLKVKIKVTDVTGAGVSIAMGTDLPNGTNTFVTTQGKRSITGTTDFKEYSLTLPYFPEQAKGTSLYLFLDGSSTGTVYFDDISLSYRN